MLRDEDVNFGLISAVREGNLERARQLIDSYGLSSSQGYVLLCDAVENNHAAVAKLLLTRGCRVNSNSMNPCDTPLHFAARSGDTEMVNMLLAEGAKIDAKNEYGKTPLHDAIGYRAMEVPELLLRHGADVDARDNYGRTPLHVAGEIGCLPIVEHLLNNGADVNCVCTTKWKKGYAPLHLAAGEGSEEVVTLLLRRGAHVDVKGEDGVTALHVAAEKGYVSIVEGLLNHGASIHSLTSRQRSTPLHISTENGRAAVVKLLLQHGAEVDNRDKDGKTALQRAVEREYLTVVEEVLKYCPDINDQSNGSSLKIAWHVPGENCKKIVEALLKYGFSVGPEDAKDPDLLHEAIEKGCLKVIEDLLKYGADVHAVYYSRFDPGVTPLHTAARHKQEEAAKLLISHGADINAQDKTRKTPIFYAIESADLNIFNLLLSNGAVINDSPELLNIAVEKGCMEIVEVLLQREFDVKASDEYGRTALHYAATTKHTNNNIKGEIAKLLLSEGANVDAQTEDGETPLHRSAQTGDKEVTIMLINKGANVNTKRKDGTTPLHIAIREGHEEVVKVLLEFGAKVDSKTNTGMKPLHLAAVVGYQEIVETILKFGADINCRDEDGRTALHVAALEGQAEVVSTLLNYGADINITNISNRTPLDEAEFSHYQRLNCRDYHGDEYDDPEHDVCPCEVIYETLKRHVARMKIANFYVSEKILQSVDWSDEMRDFQNNCEEEIEDMKSVKINNLNITFYDILAKDASKLAIYMGNENIVHVLKSDDYKIEFPIYASIIKAHFKKGMERKELLEEANIIFHSLFNVFPQLPYDCTDQIFSYLSEEDTKNFNRCLLAY